MLVDGSDSQKIRFRGFHSLGAPEGYTIGDLESLDVDCVKVLLWLSIFDIFFAAGEFFWGVVELELWKLKVFRALIFL